MSGEDGLFDRPILRLDPGVHTAMIKRADVDAAGHWAVTGSEDCSVRIWLADTGAMERMIPIPLGPGDIGKIYAVAISPDGAMIAAGGWTHGVAGAEQIYLFGRFSAHCRLMHTDQDAARNAGPPSHWPMRAIWADKAFNTLQTAKRLILRWCSNCGLVLNE